MAQCTVCESPASEQNPMVQIDESVFVCKPCAEAIVKTLDEDQNPNVQPEFSLKKPSEIKAHLDQYVIGQDKAKKTLAVAVYNHYKRIANASSGDDIELQKSNVLVVGPTGTGKTHIAQTLARLIGVPFAIADATSLTEAGYVGDDTETVLNRLLDAADGDIEKAQVGIVYIDEIDKIARKQGQNTSITRDVSGEGVQQALLKLIEGSECLVNETIGKKNPNGTKIKFDTTNVLFICGGSFAGIENMMRNKMNKKLAESSIGFGAKVKSHGEEVAIDYKTIVAEDLKDFGMIPELLGRLPIITGLDPITDEVLVNILTQPKNALVKQYAKLFDMDGAELNFTEESLMYIAKEAMKHKVGARGLRTIMEKILEPKMFTLPDEAGQKVIVDIDWCRQIFEGEAAIAISEIKSVA